MLSPDICNQLETKTVEDQLEGVRGEHNHTPKERVQETGAEGSEIEERCQYDKYQYGILPYAIISDAIGHLIDFSYK